MQIFLIFILNKYNSMCKSNLNCVICNKPTKFNCQTCSRECGNVLKKQKTYEERVCVFCKTPFLERKKVGRKLCSEECRKKWNALPENKAQRIKSTEDAVLKKYGVKSTLLLDSTKEKISKAKIEKYSDEHYTNPEKRKKTCLEKYGSENPMKNDLVKTNLKNTKKEKYGDENYNNRTKANKTSLDKYGTKFPIQLDQFKEKRKETNKEKYNADHPLKNKEVQRGMKKTILEKYGTEYISQNKEIKKKITETWSKKIEETKAFILFKSLSSISLNLIGKFSGVANASYESDLPSYKEYNFECLNCGSKFKATFANYCLPSCKKCNPPNKSSKIQDIIRRFLKENKINYLENYRHAIEKKELDFYISDKKIAIEINGNYFHSERAGQKNKSYHINKTILCEEKGIKLIHIFEDEIILNEKIVLSKLKHILGLQSKDNTVYARKCNIKIVEPKVKSKFLKENHLQGNCISKINVGLYYNNQIISIATFSQNRVSLGQKSKEGEWELTRFCNLINHNIPGAFSKLLSFFIKKYKPKKIISYCEIRYSGISNTNNMYVKNGFVLEGITKPSYWYFEKNNYIFRHHRFNFRKNIILKIAQSKNISTEKLTEWEIAQNLNMDRIWDCGQMKYVINF